MRRVRCPFVIFDHECMISCGFMSDRNSARYSSQRCRQFPTAGDLTHADGGGSIQARRLALSLCLLFEVGMDVDGGACSHVCGKSSGRPSLARLNDCSNKYERHAYRVRRNRHALARSRAAALSCSKHHTLITHSLVCVCASCDRGRQATATIEAWDSV